MVSLTERQDSLVDSLNAHFSPTNVGHWFEIMNYPKVLIISLNWRLQTSRSLSSDIQKLRDGHEEDYMKALRYLEATGDYSSYECNSMFSVGYAIYSTN